MKGNHVVTALAVGVIAVTSVVVYRGAERFGQREVAIAKAEAARPAVTFTRPGNLENGVGIDAYVSCDIDLPTSGAGVDVASLSGDAVRLVNVADGSVVPAKFNTSGAGDALVLTPEGLLRPDTTYSFEVTPSLKDTSGATFKPFKMTFSTAANVRTEASAIAFEKVELADTKVLMPGTQMPSAYTSLTFGPDGRLYAGTFDGRIFKYDVLPDGSLGKPETIPTVQAASKGPRIITGISFDPASTVGAPMLWVAHGQMAFNEGRIEGADDWTSKISLLQGSSLSDYKDAVIHLPRAFKDHLNFQMAFGPDGAMYFCQGSNTSTGAPDKKWNFRDERLLTAAVLRLDPAKIANFPLDVKTQDGGTYDPTAPGAPLTIHATGVRSGFDLLWHSNGFLYTGLNGAAAGGNVPGVPRDAQGQQIPPIFDIKETTHDLLLKIVKGGYYGHPNPLRNEFVLMGGNPTKDTDPQEIRSYPVGIKPEANFQPPAYDFGYSVSPNGLLEYKSAAFDGALKGKILVTRYSGGKDIVVLTPGADGNIVEVTRGIDGFTRFSDPLDIVENPKTGYLYVAEYGGRQITLLKPRTGGSARVFHSIVGK